MGSRKEIKKLAELNGLAMARIEELEKRNAALEEKFATLNEAFATVMSRIGDGKEKREPDGIGSVKYAPEHDFGGAFGC